MFFECSPGARYCLSTWGALVNEDEIPALTEFILKETENKK